MAKPNLLEKIRYQIRDAQHNRLASYAPKLNTWPGKLGDGHGVVQNPDYPDGYVYVRDLHGNLLTVYNNKVPSVSDLFIVFGYDQAEPKLLQVIAQWTTYQNQPYQSLPSHGKTHRWPNVDTVFMMAEQFLPALLFSDNSFSAVLYPGYVQTAGGWHYIPYQTINFYSHKPTSGARAVLVSVDDSGAIVLTNGSIVSSFELVAPENFPATPANHRALYAVRLYSSQAGIKMTEKFKDIYDLRFFQFGAGGSGGGAAGTTGSVQYNDSGSFAADSGFRYDPALFRLYVDDNQVATLLDIPTTSETFSVRWIADGSGTIFILPDYASQFLAVYDNALRVDPLEVNISADGGQIEFDTAPTAGHVIVADFLTEEI
jgi:hypothetical protein